MKKIGLIGGMSWESSAVYYELLNQEVKKKLGGFHSCSCLMESVDFAEIEKLQHLQKWDELCQIMQDKAMILQNGGAEIILLCTNTMHLCSNKIQEKLEIPFLHIAEATGEEIRNQGLSRVALLGTKFTMEEDFYVKTLKDDFQIETIIPEAQDRQLIHDCIYQELVQGTISKASKEEFIRIIEKLEKRGAQGVILGCTEIPLLIKQEDVNIPVFDTTRIHAQKAVHLAITS